jgi:hypothetical protein
VAPGDVLPGDAGDRQGLSTTMVAFAALSPRFLFR